ncbi:P-loop NTPase fold protein [Methanococcus maripaludis]|uniref:Putative KAP-like P-loop ATPase n=1 Tax=Methanococcus maripaludis TaxID=39152 RepID=A0A7J9PN39_METMI|nr:P-loop NTPase fold protein [Methanococcus maripaludis]MBA2864027.1 putative KAP-like P-loop ATPase [Methanococcus maripaludis]
MEDLLFLKDEPIKNYEEDVLGRGSFARSLANRIVMAECEHNSQIIGLYGHWGSGKSSIINLMLKNIEELEGSYSKLSPRYIRKYDGFFYKLSPRHVNNKKNNQKKSFYRKMEYMNQFNVLLSTLFKILSFFYRILSFFYFGGYYLVALLYSQTKNFAYYLSISLYMVNITDYFYNELPNINKYHRIIKFEPWNYYGKKELISNFFEQLSANIHENEPRDISNKILPLINAYAEVIGNGLNTIGIPLMTPLIKHISKPNTQKSSLDEQKNRLIEALGNLNHKIIIIIDDIDRLPKSEIVEIFQLVKAVADFPNIVYLLSFDKEIVANALCDIQSIPEMNHSIKKAGNSDTYLKSGSSKPNISTGYRYIEKMIPISFEIPNVDKNTMLYALNTKLKEIYGQNYNVNEVNASNYYQNDEFFLNVERYLENINYKLHIDKCLKNEDIEFNIDKYLTNKYYRELIDYRIQYCRILRETEHIESTVYQREVNEKVSYFNYSFDIQEYLNNEKYKNDIDAGLENINYKLDVERYLGLKTYSKFEKPFIDNGEFEKLWNNGLKYFFRNIRDVIRFLNNFTFNYSFIRNDVNLYDFLSITAIQTSIPELYDWIGDNEEFLVHDEKNSGLNRGISQEYREEIITKIKKYTEELNQISRTNQISLPKLIEFLTIIFPKLNYWDDVNVKIKKEEFIDGYYSNYEDCDYLKKICGESTFSTYFNLNVPKNVISYYMLHYLSKPRSFEEYTKFLKELSNNGILDRYLEDIDMDHSVIDKNNYEMLLNRLFTIETLISKYEDTYTILKSTSHLIYNLIFKSQNIQNYYLYDSFEDLLEITSEADCMVPLFMGFLINIEESRVNPVLSKEELLNFKKYAIKYIKRRIRDETLEYNRYLRHILEDWSKWGDPEDIKSFIKSIKNNENLINAVLFAFDGHSLNIDSKKMDEFFEFDYLKMKIQEIKKSKNYNELYPDKKELLNKLLKYIKQQKSYSKNTPPKYGISKYGIDSMKADNKKDPKNPDNNSNSQ